MPKYNSAQSKFDRRRRAYKSRCRTAKNGVEEVYTLGLGKKYGKLYVFYRQLLRDLIANDIKEWKADWFLKNKASNGLFKCELTGKFYKSSELECDHHVPKFRDLAESFAKEYDLKISWDLFKSKVIEVPKQIDKPISPYADIPIHGKKNDKEHTNDLIKKIQLKQLQIKNDVFIDKSDIYYKEFKDQSLNSKWIEYHNKHALLRMIYWKVNRQMM